MGSARAQRLRWFVRRRAGLCYGLARATAAKGCLQRAATASSERRVVWLSKEPHKPWRSSELQQTRMYTLANGLQLREGNMQLEAATRARDP